MGKPRAKVHHITQIDSSLFFDPPQMFQEIIHFLKQNRDYLSGEDISRSLRISRAAVWKYIHQLREMGYDICAVPHLGYRLESVPDRLFSWEIQQDLGTKIFGRKILYHETVPSTMDEAFALGVGGEPEGTLVCAEGQSKGRGRMGRTWISPKGKGIYMSLLLRPQLPPARVAELTLLTAIAVCEAVNQICGITARIKWPNDIMIENGKAGGILTEMSAEMDRVTFVVLGIGLNVSAVPGRLADRAVALRQVAQKDFTRLELVRGILLSLEHWYMLVHQEGISPIVQRWKELSLTLGRHVRLTESGGTIEGRAVDLAEDGGLLIRTSNGILVKRMSGDVILG